MFIHLNQRNVFFLKIMYIQINRAKHSESKSTIIFNLDVERSNSRSSKIHWPCVVIYLLASKDQAEILEAL